MIVNIPTSTEESWNNNNLTTLQFIALLSALLYMIERLISFQKITRNVLLRK
ncbi:hypothetical protein VCR14J2_270197 [Vibrio coralliirubri]|nr:hypothetical protein VCR14J2_270197 [Vibrio coralliirubri]